MHSQPARLCFKIINASHNRPSPRVPEQRELHSFLSLSICLSVRLTLFFSLYSLTLFHCVWIRSLSLSLCLSLSFDLPSLSLVATRFTDNFQPPRFFLHPSPLLWLPVNVDIPVDSCFCCEPVFLTLRLVFTRDSSRTISLPFCLFNKWEYLCFPLSSRKKEKGKVCMWRFWIEKWELEAVELGLRFFTCWHEWRRDLGITQDIQNRFVFWDLICLFFPQMRAKDKT